MLKKLTIQNYAIIDEIEIEFSTKLNIITGETGAGKSILMGALSLILGERADSTVLVNQQKKCFIEGCFLVNGKKAVIDYLQMQELDIENELVIRREIAINGKSRAFINDTPATLQQLRTVASMLVDLHQQFDSLELGDSEFQQEVLDALANNESNLKVYQKKYQAWLLAGKELADLQLQKTAFHKELDYNRFLFDELNELGLKENELEDLTNELKLLNNAEGIKNTLTTVYYSLAESEQPIVVSLKQLVHQLQSYSSLHQGLQSVINRLQSAQIEVQDIATEIDNINQSVNFDAQRIEWINQRLMDGYKLLKKHAVQDTNQLLTIMHQLEEKLEAVLQIDDQIALKEKELVALLADAKMLADSISIARHQQVNPLEEQVNSLLKQVGMPNARLKVQLKEDKLSATGKDAINFLFNANVPAGKTGNDNHFEPIAKVASGGELSRLMLCIKSLVAQSIDLPTMIFDEIDTGISGEAAKQVGNIMKDLTNSRQIICITHQPQIAGKADAHFFVFKEIKNDAVKTNIRLLNQEERITAIARMLSGEKPTAAALENAREMIMN